MCCLPSPLHPLLSTSLFPRETFSKQQQRQWCGNIENEIPIAERLLDFARSSIFSRVAFAEMLFGLRCPPGFALCDPNVQVREDVY